MEKGQETNGEISVTMVWEVKGGVCVPDPICAEHSRYLRQSGKACGIFVTAGTVARSHPPCVIPVTAQVVWVAFVCLMTGVRIKTVLFLTPLLDLGLPKCFSSDL